MILFAMSAWRSGSMRDIRSRMCGGTTRHPAGSMPDRAESTNPASMSSASSVMPEAATRASGVPARLIRSSALPAGIPCLPNAPTTLRMRSGSTYSPTDTPRICSVMRSSLDAYSLTSARTSVIPAARYAASTSSPPIG